MKFIIGKKIEMSQIWRGDVSIAVTSVQAGPCIIVQVKNNQKDKYSAVQLGYGNRKAKNIKKPQIGHMKDLGNFQYLKEFRTDNTELKRGDKIDVSTFAVGDKINVVGTSKGKGFQGVVKRHGFHGHGETHGTKDQVRTSGSVGPKGPAHVFKGTRMAGHMGDDRVTIANLEIIDVDKEKNIILIKGAVPGARNGLLMISAEGDLKIAKAEVEKEAAPVEAEAKEEPVAPVEDAIVSEPTTAEISEAAPETESTPTEDKKE